MKKCVCNKPIKPLEKEVCQAPIVKGVSINPTTEAIGVFPNPLSIYRENPIGRYIKTSFENSVVGVKTHTITFKKENG